MTSHVRARYVMDAEWNQAGFRHWPGDNSKLPIALKLFLILSLLVVVISCTLTVITTRRRRGLRAPKK